MSRGVRGEVSTGMIVGIILAITGFLILVYFLIQLDIRGQGSDQACKFSILSRSTAPKTLLGLKSAFPLLCETKKLCFGGTCPESFAGSSVKSISVSKDAGKAQETIEKTIADTLYQCWDMVGRGKYDVFGSLGVDSAWSETKPRCLICSRIAFDEKVPRSVLNQVNVKKYMEAHTAPNSQLSYLKAIGAGSDTIQTDASAAIFLDTNTSVTFKPKSKEIAFVFMQISAPAAGEATAKNLGYLATGTFLLSRVPGSKTYLFQPVIRAVKASPLVAVVAAVSSVLFVETNSLINGITASGYCGTYEQGRSQGCSLVQAIPYDASAVNQVCEYIEGSP